MQPVPPDLDPADLAACRAMLRGGSRTFAAAARVLPRAVHEPATALYAFCRVADDAIDCGGGGAAALAPLHDRLERAYAGFPLPLPADRALAAVVAGYSIPKILPAALLEGFAWDAQGRRYEDIGDLLDYAARVAGTVGAMMAALMGVRAPDVVARACDLGVAMQLTNIARDVGEDARAGRLYLPLRWLREAGIDPDAWLARPEYCRGLAGVVQKLLTLADTLYARADAGIARLPLSCRPGIAAARLLYCEIGQEVRRRDCDSVSQRAVVPRARKAALLARSYWAAARPRGAAPLPSLRATQFLVDALAIPRRPVACPQPQPARGFDDRVAWLLALFARLEARDRLQEHRPALVQRQTA